MRLAETLDQLRNAAELAMRAGHDAVSLRSVLDGVVLARAGSVREGEGEKAAATPRGKR